MSGPKCVSEPTFSLADLAGTACAAIGGAVFSLGVLVTKGVAHGVTGLAKLSVASVNAIADSIRQAREEQERRAEERRCQQLSQAKQSELARVDAAIERLQNLYAIATGEFSAVQSDCAALKKNLQRLDFSFTVLAAVDLSPVVAATDACVVRQRARIEKLRNVTTERIGALRAYRTAVGSHETIASLEQAQATCPSDVVIVGQSDARENVASLQAAREQLAALKLAMTSVDRALTQMKMTKYADMVSEAIALCDVTAAVSVSVAVKAVERIVSLIERDAAIAKSEEFAQVFAHLQDTLKEFHRRDGATVVKGSMIDYGALCATHMEAVSTLTTKLYALAYLAPHVKSSVKECVAAAAKAMRTPIKGRAEIAALAESEATLRTLAEQAAMTDRHYARYLVIQERIESMNAQLGLNTDEGIRFQPLAPIRAIEEAERICLEKERKLDETKQQIVVRDICAAMQETERTDNAYIVYSMSSMPNGDRRLLFARRGRFGALYEYVVRPGGAMRRRVIGTKNRDGKKLVNDEMLVSIQTADCADMERVKQKFEEMYVSFEYSEEYAPSVSRVTDEDYETFLSLEAENAYMKLTCNQTTDSQLYRDRVGGIYSPDAAYENGRRKSDNSNDKKSMSLS